MPSSGEIRSGAEGAGCDTSSIAIIHGLLRHLYRGTRDLVSDTSGTDKEQVRGIGHRLAIVSVMTHDHHGTEDLMWWDKINDRTASCPMHVAAMSAQHQQLGALISRQAEAAPPWLDDPTPERSGPVRGAA